MARFLSGATGALSLYLYGEYALSELSLLSRLWNGDALSGLVRLYGVFTVEEDT